MSKKFIIQSQYLPAGKYSYKEAKKWHEQLRVKLALWLLNSIHKEPLEIKTTTG